MTDLRTSPERIKRLRDEAEGFLRNASPMVKPNAKEDAETVLALIAMHYAAKTEDAFDTADLYACDLAADRYHHTSAIDAVMSWLPDQWDGRDELRITVHAFKRAEWPSPFDLAETAIDAMRDRIEGTCEELINPDGWDSPTVRMRAAAFDFAKVFAAEHTVFHCEKVAERTLTVAQWRELAKSAEGIA